jgi:hypothetical protein
MRACLWVLMMLAWLVSPGWSQEWATPELVPESSRTRVAWKGQRPMSGGRVLRWARSPEGMILQLDRGKLVLWRTRAKLLPGLLPMRYEAQSESLVVLRGFAQRRQQAVEVGDVALAVNLQDGKVAWMSEPIACSREQPGVPNVQRGDRVYETVLSPTLAPLLLARRISDGRTLFWRYLPQQDEQPFDLMGRHVDRLVVGPNDLTVSLVDKFQHWENYVFSVHDGTLKSFHEQPPPPPQPPQVKRKEKNRLWSSPGTSISGLKKVKSSSK